AVRRGGNAVSPRVARHRCTVDGGLAPGRASPRPLSGETRAMMIPPFSIARLPRIIFGAGSLAQVPDLLAAYGRRVLLVTGARSVVASAHWESPRKQLEARNVAWVHFRVEGEPSPQLVDDAVRELKDAGIESVAGIGGGSVLDAAKAIAGLLRVGNSVMDYLEGMGLELPYQGPALPYIAVPTTAGTGSEATKNAVL